MVQCGGGLTSGGCPVLSLEYVGLAQVKTGRTMTRKKEVLECQTSLDRLTAGRSWPAGKDYVRRMEWVVGEGSMVDFGPDFGARLSKQLKLRGTGASYNFWRPASFVGHALTFQATTPPTVASHPQISASLTLCLPHVWGHP